jgi:hypothetical protein
MIHTSALPSGHNTALCVNVMEGNDADRHARKQAEPSLNRVYFSMICAWQNPPFAATPAKSPS